MSKNNLYKKVIVSVSGVALLSVSLSQMPNTFLTSSLNEVNAAQKTKTIGANSAVYRRQGKKMIKTKQIIKIGKKVNVYGQKTVKGKRFYKIGNGQFIKAVNVDGRIREATESTVLYTRKGKALKHRNILKGQEVMIYGGAVKIKGKKYYSTKHGYIKASVLVKKEQVEPPKNPSSENNKPVVNVPSYPDNSGSVSVTDPLKGVKDDAITAVKQAVEDATNLIETSPLTAAEKQEANAKIDAIAKTALGEQKDGKSGAIKDAKSADEVKAIQAQVESECKFIGDKIVSSDLVNQAKEFANKAIVKMEDGEAKTAAPAKIASAVDSAKKAISAAKTQAEIEEAEKSFQTALNEAVPFDKQQEFAVDSVNQAVEFVKAAISANDSLTDEQKQAVISEIEVVAKIAIGEQEDGTAGQIHDAETTNDILLAQNMVLAKCKTDLTKAAIAAVKQAVEDATNLIEASPLTAVEKQEANAKIDAIAKAALGDQQDGSAGEIHDAKSEEEIKLAQDKAVSACELEKNRLVSKDLVKQDAEFINKIVAKMEDGDAKTAASEKIASAVETTRKAITAAETQAEIDKAAENFQAVLNGVIPFAKQQEFAIATAKDAVSSAKERIDANTSLTDEQKQDSISEIEAVVKIALGEQEDGATGQIHDAKTTNEVLLAQNMVISFCESKK